MEIEFSLLENGFDFILSSLEKLNKLKNIDEDIVLDNTKYEEEYIKEEKRSLIKYSLLHLSAGMELIFKYRLLQENWVYIFNDMNIATKEKYESGDFISVNNETALKRLKELCNIKIEDKDYKTLKKIRALRNRSEHYKFNSYTIHIKDLINKTIIILFEIIYNNFDLNKFSIIENKLFEKTKTQLFYLDEHDEIVKRLSQKQLKTLKKEDKNIIVKTCPNCGEEFLIINKDETIQCLFCPYVSYPEYVAYDYIKHINLHNNTEDSVYICIECKQKTFIFDEKDNKYFCFNCHIDYNKDDISFCDCCGAPFVNNDHEDCCCDNCNEHAMNKG